MLLIYLIYSPPPAEVGLGDDWNFRGQLYPKDRHSPARKWPASLMKSRHLRQAL